MIRYRAARTPATQMGHAQTQDAGRAGYILTTNNNNTTLEERSFKLPDYCTVYQTELTAIIEACKYLSTYANTHGLIVSPLFKLSPRFQRGVELLETVMTLLMHSDPLTL